MKDMEILVSHILQRELNQGLDAIFVKNKQKKYQQIMVKTFPKE